MSQSPHKLPFILLALLLALSPLQNAIAALDVHPSMPTGLHAMNHGATMDMDAQGMSDDCPHCVDHNGCGDHDCSQSHCASCVPGLLRATLLNLTACGADSYPRLEPILSDRFISHPFRPPKA